MIGYDTIYDMISYLLTLCYLQWHWLAWWLPETYVLCLADSTFATYPCRIR